MVYAVIEIMSKKAVCGGANLILALLFTALISYFLKFGQYFASEVIARIEEKEARDVSFDSCSKGVSEYWFLILVPVSALSWSALLFPRYRDLPVMAFHGCLAYAVKYYLSRAGMNDMFNNFAAAASVTFSASFLSRFVGGQAIVNTVAGLYVLVPGAYLVNSFQSTEVNIQFFLEIVERALVLGMGSWAGTVLCSPSVLGSTVGIIQEQANQLRRVSSGLGGGNEMESSFSERRHDSPRRRREGGMGAASTEPITFF